MTPTGDEAVASSPVYTCRNYWQQAPIGFAPSIQLPMALARWGDG
jgi:hypothetical protein